MLASEGIKVSRDEFMNNFGEEELCMNLVAFCYSKESCDYANMI
jgi:hypothetical protein